LDRDDDRSDYGRHELDQLCGGIVDNVRSEIVNLPDSWFSEGVSAAIAAVVGGVVLSVKRVYGRIRRLEDCTVRKKEFDELEKATVTRAVFEDHAARAETDRKEMREGIVKLFDKVDEIKTILIAKNIDG
jgi:hypothetical protein